MMSVEIMKLGPVHIRFDLLLPLVTQSWRVTKDEFSWGMVDRTSVLDWKSVVDAVQLEKLTA